MMSEMLKSYIKEWNEVKKSEEISDSLRWRELKSIQDCIRSNVQNEVGNFTDAEKLVIEGILNVNVLVTYM